MPRKRHQNGFVKPTGKRPRTWTGYWYEYRIVDGVEKRLERSRVLGPQSEMTKGEAKERLRRIIQGFRPQASSTFAEVAEAYLNLKSGDWGRKQQRTIQSIFKTQILPTFGDKSVSQIRATDVKGFLNELARQSSQSVVKKCLTQIRAVFDYLIEDDVLMKNPAKARLVTMPKTRKPSDRFLEVSECRALLNAAKRPRDRVILHIFLALALRPGEGFALRLDDVYPGRLRIDEAFVPGEGLKEPKTKESDGFVPLPPLLEMEIRQYIATERISDPRAFLFPSVVGTAVSHDNYLDRVLKRIGSAAGIQNVNFQVLRRTVATWTQNHGQPKSVQGLLRHKRVETTLGIYQKQLDPNVSDMATQWDAQLLGQAAEIVQ